MTLLEASIDDKYTLRSGRALMTGTQALVRLPLLQRERDLAAGLNTAGFISGYRGSPIGGYDKALWSAQELLQQHHIVFRAGVNEELAATAVWGTQQVGVYPNPKYDGVFAVWYGKGPGVDRAGDALKHGNLSGAAKHGGVLVVFGDDHSSKSSTIPHQSEQALAANHIPVVYPATVQEYIDFGLLGWAMSRFSGLWVAFKCVNETIDNAASTDVGLERLKIVIPTDVTVPPEGVGHMVRYAPLEEERRLIRIKMPLLSAFARANPFDRVVMDSPRRRLGIVSAGKSYLDVLQALDMLGIDEARADALGISLYKVGLIWPVEQQGLLRFATGLKEILFVEEKRAFLEDQAARILYNASASDRPRIVGKFDEAGRPLLPSDGQLQPHEIAQAIFDRLRVAGIEDDDLNARAARIRAKLGGNISTGNVLRTPYFCSGCPHNRSTVVPEGSVAMSGIGCHGMTMLMQRSGRPTQMGGEGLTWTGIAPFTNTPHAFQNLGDGTYSHSGMQAIRAAVASGVNITYKILYNDAVAMTGGQPVEGNISVAAITQQVAALGVDVIRVVTDEPDKYPSDVGFAAGVTVHHRDELEAIQREMRELPGTTVLIYDQTCAAEKRRRRKRKQFPDPQIRAFINEAVCEGCGDCSVKANCMSIEPVETEFGRKRHIDQSSCNKDYSCITGFCPSFVSVVGGGLRKPEKIAIPAGRLESLPEPQAPALDRVYSMLITGVGGTGVVTVGAVLAMAAHLEGKGASVHDMTGMSQKGGAVFSHLRLAPKPDDIHAVPIGFGEADVVVGCDLVVTAGKDTLDTVGLGQTRAVVNSHLVPTGAFQRNPDFDFQVQRQVETIQAAVGQDRTYMFDANDLALKLMGSTAGANVATVGYAYQLGCVPLSLAAIERAIELNGVSVEANKQAFALGRLAAHDPALVASLLSSDSREKAREIPQTLDEQVRKGVAFLTDYQDSKYGARYADLVAQVTRAERAKTPGMTGLSEAVARYFLKLLAYKDEYEVARLYTNGDFRKKLEAEFSGPLKLKFHLAPPLIARRDPATGELKKREFGPWVFSLFKVLAPLKVLRGTALDIFGYTAERKTERKLIEDYAQTVSELLERLTPENHAAAVSIAQLPDQIRGYGHVKDKNIAAAEARKQELLDAFRQQQPLKLTA